MCYCLKVLSLSIMLTFSVASLSAAATFTWNGAGRSGGTGDPTWSTPGNWLEGVSAPPNAPTEFDDVTVGFNEAYTGSYALIIDAGATGNDVLISGFNVSSSPLDRRRVQVTGDASFNSLRVSNGGTNATANSIFEILAGATITLSGGSAGTPTFRDGSAAAPTSVIGEGAIDFTGQDVYLDVNNEFGNSSITFSNASPSATIQNNNKDLEFVGDTISFRSTQTLSNFPLLRLDGPSDLVSGDGNPLHNFSDVHLGVLYRFGNATAPAGTFASLAVSANINSTGNPTYRMRGNQEIVSDIVGDGSGNAVNIVRSGRDGSVATLHVDGYDLNVSSTAPVSIGSNHAFTSYAVLNMNANAGAGRPNSNVTLAGDLILNTHGVLVGNSGSTLTVGGNFSNASTLNANYSVSNSTLIMGGAGTQFAAQTLEVQGTDLTAASHAAGMALFGWGSLEIGSSVSAPTWVELVDLFDFGTDSAADAMYVDTLLVREGSFLALNNQKLYVNGVQVMPGDTIYGDGIIVNLASDYVPPVPEPSSFVLLGLGALVLRKKRGIAQVV